MEEREGGKEGNKQPDGSKKGSFYRARSSSVSFVQAKHAAREEPVKGAPVLKD